MDSNITYWTDADGQYIGHLKTHPDRQFRSDNLQDLKAQLKDFQQTIKAERVWEGEGGRIRKPKPPQGQ